MLEYKIVSLEQKNKLSTPLVHHTATITEQLQNDIFHISSPNVIICKKSQQMFVPVGDFCSAYLLLM